MKKQTWEERFEEFGELYSFPFGLTNSVMGYKFEKDGSNSTISGKCDTEEIKSFLSNVISQTKKEAYEKGRLETIKEIVDWIEGYIKENKGINPIPTVEESVAREIQSKIQSILNQLKDNE